MKSKDYQEFTEKFKPKLTTDDCITPDAVYDAVLGWVCKEYGVTPEQVVRPFWPGMDYQKAEYPEGCVVVDNPPFSILAQIQEWFLDREIKFFLFAPSLTALSGRKNVMRVNHLICNGDVTYENGAKVKTAFVTNLGDGETVLQTAPELGRIVNAASAAAQEERNKKKSLPKYIYPDEVVTAAILQRWAAHGVEFKVRRCDCMPISRLDGQREKGDAIFGGGLLLSERAAAERAAVERVAAERWTLSDREKALVAELGTKGEGVRCDGIEGNQQPDGKQRLPGALPG